MNDEGKGSERGGPAVPGCQHTGPSFESRDRSPSTAGARAVPPACTPANTHNVPCRDIGRVTEAVLEDTSHGEKMGQQVQLIKNLITLWGRLKGIVNFLGADFAG